MSESHVIEEVQSLTKERDELRAKLEVLTGAPGLNIISAVMAEHLSKREHYAEWKTKTLDGRELIISAQWIEKKSPATLHQEIKTAFGKIVEKVERAHAQLETLKVLSKNLLCRHCEEFALDKIQDKIEEVQQTLTLGSVESEAQEALPLDEKG